MRKEWMKEKVSVCTLHTSIEHVQCSSSVSYLSMLFLAIVGNTRIGKCHSAMIMALQFHESEVSCAVRKHVVESRTALSWASLSCTGSRNAETFVFHQSDHSNAAVSVTERYFKKGKELGVLQGIRMPDTFERAPHGLFFHVFTLQQLIARNEFRNKKVKSVPSF